MSKQYSFLSPENINFLILKLRGIYPENKHAEIRECIPYVASDWFQRSAPLLEDQFVYGTQYLNEQFIHFLAGVEMFRDNPVETNPSYSTEIADPYVPNQRFQNVNNDIEYPNNRYNYNARNLKELSGINQELNEATIGGVPIYGNLIETSMAELATEISRNRARKNGAPVLRSTLRDVYCDSRAAELPALPRAKYTLPRDYYESTPGSAYWTGLRTGTGQGMVGKNMRKYTEWSQTGNNGLMPMDENCTNSRMYASNGYTFPNYTFYRKDFIPTRRYQNSPR